MPTTTIKRVLIATSATADDRKALSAVRSLGKRDITVTVGSNSRACLPRHSRFCGEFIQYPNPADDARGFASSLMGYLQSHPRDAVLALCDYTTQAFARHAEELNRLTGICVPSAEQLAVASDKARVLELAENLGIGTPKTFCIDGAEELRRASSLIDYPCVLKLRRGAGGVGRRFLDSPAALHRAYTSLPAGSDPVFDYARPLVQEFIPGEIHDACALYSHGEPCAVLTQKRLAMYPAVGGVGIYNETTHDPELKAQAMELLGAMRWHGPAQVEFKRDARDGRLRLMEVNPRFWGTLDLSVQAGIDFPYLAALIAVRGDVEPVFEYKVGMRERWMFSYKSPEHPVANLQLRALRDALFGGALDKTDFWPSDPFPHVVGLMRGCSGSLRQLFKIERSSS